MTCSRTNSSFGVFQRYRRFVVLSDFITISLNQRHRFNFSFITNLLLPRQSESKGSSSNLISISCKFFKLDIIIIIMQQSKEYINQSHTIEQSQTTKPKNLPLLVKRLNPVEKYINAYKNNQKSEDKNIKDSKLSNKFSINASRLIFQRKYTPDPNASQIIGGNCYVKYQPLIQQKRQQKLQSLQKLQRRYSHLKNNLNDQKGIYISKYTLPLYQRRKIDKDQQLKSKLQFSRQQIQKQLRKQILIQNGKKYYADLYMMKKDRQKLKQQIKKNQKLAGDNIDQNHKQHEKYLIEKKTKQAEDKKNKMLKNKGLHWNVYYQMMALTKNQKQRLKQGNSPFVTTYGTN